MFACQNLRYFAKTDKRRALLQGGIFKSTPKWCLSVFANELFICFLFCKDSCSCLWSRLHFSYWILPVFICNKLSLPHVYILSLKRRGFICLKILITLFWATHKLGFKCFNYSKEYSVILTTSFYDMNQKILTKKKAYFQNFSWFQFYVYKLCMILLHRLY